MDTKEPQIVEPFINGPQIQEPQIQEPIILDPPIVLPPPISEGAPFVVDPFGLNQPSKAQNSDPFGLNLPEMLYTNKTPTLGIRFKTVIRSA